MTDTYFTAQLFFLNRTWFIVSCFFSCGEGGGRVSNIKRETESFSLFVNMPDIGNERFCVFKLVATVYVIARGRWFKTERKEAVAR